MNTQWTPERLAEMKAMLEGGSSFKEIGLAMGVSRNAAIGAANRAGIRAAGISNSKRTHCPKGHPYEGSNLYIKPSGFRVCVTCKNNAPRKQRIQKRAALRRKVNFLLDTTKKTAGRGLAIHYDHEATYTQIIEHEDAPLPVRINGKPLRLLDLNNTHCRFVVGGKGADAEFCGDQKKPNEAWCEFHEAFVFNDSSTQDYVPKWSPRPKEDW